MTYPMLSPRVFLGILGFGLAIMFCTTFCRACGRLREEQITREAIRRTEQDGRLQSIYFIPFPRSISPQDSEDQHDGDDLRPPRYSTTVYTGPPPSYNEVMMSLPATLSVALTKSCTTHTHLCALPLISF